MAIQEPQTATVANPVIDQSGAATFGKNNFCTWKTKDGSQSTCTIANPGFANTLTIMVSGAPADGIICSDGKPFNGEHTLSPNNPDGKLLAAGDFKGTQVTIFNMSSLDTPCQVNVVTA